MHVKIADVHNAHGLTFELILERDASDKDVFGMLQNFFGYIAKDKRLALYSYKIVVTDDRLRIGLAEQSKRLARVDHLWNSDREDQKCLVLVMETEGATCHTSQHFICHWCDKQTWGVNRDTVEVYDQKLKKMTLVSVHRECQSKREKQIASIPFEA